MFRLETGDTSIVEVLRNAVKRFSAHDMTTYAAALAYQAIFAIFPFLLFLIALLGVLDIPEVFTWLLEEADKVLSDDAYRWVETIVTQVRSNSAGGFLSAGMLLALWSSSGGMRALMNALNRAFEVEESRPIWLRYLLSIAFTVAMVVFLIVIAGLTLLGPDTIEWLADRIGLGSVFVAIWTWVRYPLLAGLLMIVVALLYRAVPNVREPFRLVTPGAVVAVILWFAASLGFSLYVGKFASYNATYGSVAGVIVALTYFYISSAVLLLGAEINAEVRRSTADPSEPESRGALSGNS